MSAGASSTAYEAVIGLEIHVQLRTRTKLFCGDLTDFGAPPNTQVCPVCLGLPGALPVPNARAIELAVRAALGFDCTVHETSSWARKNYVYPDLPKGYQITRFERPLATGGWLDVRGGEHGNGARVRLRRIHLEEDAGKSVHDRFPDLTAVDLNRTGVPLIEIVTEPDLHAPAAARAFLTRLKQTLQYLDVSDCDMEKGSLRVDANVSVRPAGTNVLGTKTEVKNMNSFASVERALAYEIERQIGLLANGRQVVQETRLWDASRAEARSMRSKEESHDYRYFPDPDLPPLVVARETVERIAGGLPERPAARADRFRAAFGLPQYDAEVLTADAAVADYYELVARRVGDGKLAGNWIMTDVLGWLNEHDAAIAAVPVGPEALAELIQLVRTGTISHTAGRRVFQLMAQTGRSAAELIHEHGLAQVSDDAQLAQWVEEIVGAFPDEVARYRGGEHKLLAFLMGQLMRVSGGKADPKRASELLRSRLVQ
jgi:aspartyl-tRNA(Asn)/glutamyl-tRNA(Gln) amidotransferase subunit B